MNRLLLLSLILYVMPGAVLAQNGNASTKGGVYTEAQSRRGQDVYAGNCKSCHTPESHTGGLFNTRWSGKTLAALYAYIRDEMPKNDPGALQPQEIADVVAYVLRLNRMPAGGVELPADEHALKQIRIETTPTIPARKDP